MTIAARTSAGAAAAAGGATIRYAVGACSLGRLLVARSAAGVCAILLGDDDRTLAADLVRRFPGVAILADPAGLAQTLTDAARLVEAPGGRFAPPLDFAGTPFQRRVWQALRAIPPGTTASYADVAARVGAPRSARAVARACAANPLAVAVPCHRVVRSDGGVSGYRWGTERKRALLAREAAA